MRFFTAFFLGLASVIAAFPSTPVHDYAQPPDPKKSFRKPDTEWEYVIRGADVKASKEYSGHLVNYKLRANALNPSQLDVDTVKQYSGYLDDNSTTKHLFYWFFESRNDPQKDPVILWLTGGPGCSSLSAVFLELGPCYMDKNRTLVSNKYAWNRNASVIFLDQPVNVGFSYSDVTVDTTVATAKDVYALLTLFFEQFPEYGRQDFHIAGESYAGHYIPIFANEILSNRHRNINIKSALIGNGLIDPLTQYRYYRSMACGQGGYLPVLDVDTCGDMQLALPKCQETIEACYHGDKNGCADSSDYCDSPLLGVYGKTQLNFYDVRQRCDIWAPCYEEIDYIQDWLNRREVMEALGVDVTSFNNCSDPINRAFRLAGDWFSPIQRYVTDILEHIPVLIYAGDVDFICNWLGNQAWTEALPWPGHDLFNAAMPMELKSLSGNNYGHIKHAKGLAFSRIYGAGHLVTHDQPEGALDLVNRWFRAEFYDAKDFTKQFQ